MNPDFATLKKMMKVHGVQRLLFKRLSPNDNSKNQPYFGPDLTSLGFIPTGEIKGTPTTSDKPKKSQVKFLAPLDFGWLDDEAKVASAPDAKLIFYPQYPEVRFSGFLRGCTAAPSELMDPHRRGREEGRILFVGIRPDQKIIGYLASADSDLARYLTGKCDFVSQGVFEEVPITYAAPPLDSRLELLQQLGRISAKGWIDSKRLQADGTSIGYNAPNGGGFTLEAEFGITPNGYSEPDFQGWEIKQYAVRNLSKPSGGRITLMTPEPNGGFYRDRGVEEFLLQFGYPDTRGRDRLNFCGTHKVRARHQRTGLTLTMPGFDAESRELTDPSSGLCLVDDAGRAAATWSYASILEHWKRKHAQAVYVPSVRRRAPKLQYRFANKVDLGTGTGMTLLLGAMAEGTVFYDPGIIMKDASGTRRPIKRRSQFRVTATNLHTLYDSFDRVSVDDYA
ncbi:MAG: MvaI/BcnI family restriction endonuclease [Woeseia sp.]